MTDHPTAPDAPEPGNEPWLTTPETYSTVPGAQPAEPAKRPRWVPWVAGAGLVAVGALVGGGVAVAVGGGDDRPEHGIGTSWTPGGSPGQQGLPGDRDGDGEGEGAGSFGPPGGVEGEQRLTGTLTAVSSDSITLSVSGSETTYALTSTSQIVVNGQSGTASDLSSGDTVLVHVIPDTNGGLVVERIFAGDLSGIPQLPTGSDDGTTGSSA